MKKITVIPNIYKDKELTHTRKVIGIINKFGGQVLLSENVAKSLMLPDNAYQESELYNKADLVLVLGGDGTLLNVARRTAFYGTPILGINLGHLGFLVELEKNNLEEFFEKLFADDYTINERMMLEASLVRESMTIDSFLALNDIGITRGAFSRIINLKLFVDNQFVDDYRADGLIIATPTGSTAYSLSAGGPIVDPNMSILMATPICPHTLHARSIIIPDNKTMSIHIGNDYFHDAMLTVDGQQGCKLKQKDIIKIEKSKCTARLVRINNTSFYDVLRKKLSERGVSE